jgi:hypothetical protein
MQHFVHGLGTESAEYLDMTFGGVFVNCTVEEGKLILDRILLVTPLEDLQIKSPLISEDEPIITYPNASDISALLGREELLQLTTPGIGSKNKIEDPTPFPLSIDEDYFNKDIANLEEFMSSKENILDLSAIISSNWSTAVEEDDNYI